MNQKLTIALEAINDVHSDTSVPVRETYDRLREIAEHLDMLLDAVSGDVARADKEVEDED